MKQVLILCLCLLILPGTARAECFVSYKAKKDAPLRLHMGVLSLPAPCPAQAKAEEQTAQRLAQAGWTLLTVLTLSMREPDDKTKADASAHYLRY